MLGLITFVLLSTLVLGQGTFEKCYQDGLCLGHLIEVQEGFNSIRDCVNKCREIETCKFASFNSKYLTCTLSRACQQVVLTGSNYQHSKVDCHHKILIFGGLNEPEPNFEIFSLENPDITCHITDTIGSRSYTIHGLVKGKPTLCGGRNPSTGLPQGSCFQYDDVQNTFVQSDDLHTAVYNTGFAPRKDSILITGGNFDGGVTGTTNVVQIVGETMTWNMPKRIIGHCMAIMEGLNSILYSNDPNEIPLTDFEAAADMPYDTDIPEGNEVNKV